MRETFTSKFKTENIEIYYYHSTSVPDRLRPVKKNCNFTF